MIHNYEKNGQLIYNESFATIRSESNLDHFSVEEEVVAVRMIHACGMIELAKSIFFYSNMAILAKESAFRDAPPTRAPSISGHFMSASTVSGVTLPPY